MLVLVLANLVLGAAALLEPVLFGRVVDSLGRKDGSAWGLIRSLGAFGGLSLVAGAAVSVGADRLAHRRRLAVMAAACPIELWPCPQRRVAEAARASSSG